jgi:NitT/TauT family transport system substrate-binding protein
MVASAPKPLLQLSGVLGAAALAATGCSRRAPETAVPAPATPILVQLDWVAEPEHGAFYTAEALGYFRDEGLNVTLVQGGPNTYVLNKVATNQAQIGQSDSTNVLLAIQAGAPLLNIASIFQHDPTVLMMHRSNPVKTWQDLEGRSIMARPEWAFLPYLRRKYGLHFQVIPQNFDLGRLAIDPNFIQMGYYIAEPYHLERRGIALKFLHVTDAGYDNYTTIFTNRGFAREHGPELRAFLRALRRGYSYYIEKDGAPAHAIMLRINPKATADYLDWSRQRIIEEGLAKDPGGDYLAMSRERYRRQIEQMEDLAILPRGALNVDAAMDASYLPK